MRLFAMNASLIATLVAAALTTSVASAQPPTSSLPPLPVSTMPSPTEIVAQQAARTLQAVADMRTRLAAIVPATPRDDAISLSANQFAIGWRNAATSFAENQMQLIDSMIIGLNQHHQDQIDSFLAAQPMALEPSLFSDPRFTNPDLTNPPLINAGFFGF